MKVSTEKLENNEVVLTVEEDAAALAVGIKKAYNRLSQRVSIPGFRKGKTPPKILERHLGKEYVLEEAFNIVYPKLLSEAMAEVKAKPATRPQLEIIKLKEGEDFSFKVTFTNWPEVTLGEYKGLNVPMPEIKVTDEDVDKQILTFQKRQGKMLDVPDDATVENGDFITLDFDGSVDGQAFEGGKSKDYPLEVGSGSFIQGFEDQLIGMSIGQEKDVNVTFPSDYQASDLAGKAAVFKCVVHSIKRQELAPADDALAKAVSKFDTMEELRADVRKNLENMAEQRAKAKRENDAVEQALANVSVEVPPVMVANQVEAMIDTLKQRIQQQGLDFDAYLEYTNTDLTKLREEYKEKAEHDVKAELMLNKIIETEKIVLTTDEIAAAVSTMATRFGTTPKQVVKILKEQNKYDDFLVNTVNQKAVKFIVDNLAEA